MLCPICKAKLKIYDSRPDGDFARVRRYECLKCGFKDITREELRVKNKT